MHEYRNEIQWLTVRVEQGLYVLLDGAPGLLQPDGDELVEKTGYRGDQLVSELLAIICFKSGNVRGRFHGESWNSVLPLVVEDHWLQSAEPAIRTWRYDAGGYTFYPYSLADLRTVTRCGSPEVIVRGPTFQFTARVSSGGEGIAFIGAPTSIDEAVLSIFEGTGIPLVRGFDELSNYIAADGTLTF